MRLLMGERQDMSFTNASRGLDEAIATKVFSAAVIHSGFGHNIVVCDFPDRKLGSHFPSLPPFSSSWEYAMMVRDVVKTWGIAREAFFGERLRALTTADMDCPDGFQLKHYEVFMHLKPHHICIAALETHALEFT